MNKRKRTKIVHEGNYVAEVDVELLEDPDGWSPYLSLEDAYRLDDVREALRRGDGQDRCELFAGVQPHTHRRMRIQRRSSGLRGGARGLEGEGTGR